MVNVNQFIANRERFEKTKKPWQEYGRTEKFMVFENMVSDQRPMDSRENKKGKFLSVAKDKRCEMITLATTSAGLGKAVKMKRMGCMWLRSHESEWETEWRQNMVEHYFACINVIDDEKFDMLCLELEVLWRRLGLPKESVNEWLCRYDQSREAQKLRKMRHPKHSDDDDDDLDDDEDDDSDDDDDGHRVPAKRMEMKCYKNPGRMIDGWSDEQLLKAAEAVQSRKTRLRDALSSSPNDRPKKGARAAASRGVQPTRLFGVPSASNAGMKVDLGSVPPGDGAQPSAAQGQQTF